MSNLALGKRLVPLLAVALLACQQDEPTGSPTVLQTTVPALAISDGAHAGGNAHFYFLPPLVSTPSYSGLFDATLQPVVDVCAITGDTCAPNLVASFTSAAGTGSEVVRIDTEDELYVVNWHTKATGALDGTYRITVKAGTTMLGYADVTLRNGARTIPIKFRIEQGAIRPAKPLWKFTVLGAVSKATADYLGGFDAAVRFMRTQFDTVNSRFNTPKGFAGKFLFSLDSIYEYTGTGLEQVMQAHAGFDYKYIVDGYQGPGGWYGDYRVVFLSWPIAEITTPGATDAIVHEFGHARGAIDLYGIKADGQFNPVNGASYHPGRSIMDFPYGETFWDQHSMNLINRCAEVVSPPPNYILDAFPSSIGIVVADDAGAPQANAKLALYPVRWFQNRVDPNARFVAYTNEQGEYAFATNPFEPWSWSSPWLIGYPNYLVTASAGTLSGYGWMPIIDVQNAWFSNPAAPYRLRIPVRPSP